MRRTILVARAYRIAKRRVVAALKSAGPTSLTTAAVGTGSTFRFLFRCLSIPQEAEAGKYLITNILAALQRKWELKAEG